MCFHRHTLNIMTDTWHQNSRISVNRRLRIHVSFPTFVCLPKPAFNLTWHLVFHISSSILMLRSRWGRRKPSLPSSCPVDGRRFRQAPHLHDSCWSWFNRLSISSVRSLIRSSWSSPNVELIQSERRVDPVRTSSWSSSNVELIQFERRASPNVIQPQSMKSIRLPTTVLRRPPSWKCANIQVQAACIEQARSSRRPEMARFETLFCDDDETFEVALRWLSEYVVRHVQTSLWVWPESRTHHGTRRPWRYQADEFAVCMYSMRRCGLEDEAPYVVDVTERTTVFFGSKVSVVSLSVNTREDSGEISKTRVLWSKIARFMAWILCDSEPRQNRCAIVSFVI